MSDSLQAIQKLVARLQFEKPLSPQAKKLRLVIESVQEEFARLKSFDAKEFISQHCSQLEVQVADAAESAIKHIKEIERALFKQIDEYRQRRLGDSRPAPSGGIPARKQQLQSSIDKTQQELGALSLEINSFSSKWKEYFNRLNVLASEAEINAAFAQAVAYQTSLKDIDRKQIVSAFNGTAMQFNANDSFQTEEHHLGELVEVPAGVNRELKIQPTSSKTMGVHSDPIIQAIFLPGERLASCSWDETIKVSDTRSDQELFTLRGHSDTVYSIFLLPNGWLASGSRDSTIKLWDLDERKEVRTLSAHSDSIVDLKVLKNGNLVSYSLDDTIKVWNPYLQENNLITTLEGHGNKKWPMPMGVLSNDLLVTCSRDMDDKEESTLRVWDSKDGQLVKSLPTVLEAVYSVLTLSNGQVAIGAADGTIKVIDLDNGQRSRAKQMAHDRHLFRIAQLSNENLVSAGVDRESACDMHSIKVWKFSDLSLLQHIKTGHTGWIWSLSISKDETLLASGSDDKTIKLWPISVQGN